MRVLPHGWRHLARQLGLFLIAYCGYMVVRGLVSTTGTDKPFGDATRIIDFERAVHVFVEPQIQAFTATHLRPLLDLADWTYLNAHFAVTVAALAYLYSRQTETFYPVRNAFLIAMAIALVGYALYPTAPPRLLPSYGFTDSIRDFTGISIDHGPTSALLNAYAAVPSMHVCFALLTGIPIARLSHRRATRLLWLAYPAFIAFVVVATGNHYLTDVVLGCATAALAITLSRPWPIPTRESAPRAAAPATAVAAPPPRS